MVYAVVQRPAAAGPACTVREGVGSRGCWLSHTLLSCMVLFFRVEKPRAPSLHWALHLDAGDSEVKAGTSALNKIVNTKCEINCDLVNSNHSL